MFDSLRHTHRMKEAIHSPHGLKLGLWIRGRFLLKRMQMMGLFGGSPDV